MKSSNTFESASDCPKFDGNKEKFLLWVSKLKTYLDNKDVKHNSRFMEKFLISGLDQPSLKRIEILEKDVEAPPKTLDPELPEFLELSEKEWKFALSQTKVNYQHFAEAKSDVKTTLSKTLPDSFLTTLGKPLNEMEPREIWKMATSHYSANDGGSLIDTYSKFCSLGCRRCQITSNFNVTQFAQLLMETRNQLNTKSDKLLGKTGAVVGGKAIAFSLLSIFPSESWANGIKFDEEFNLEKTVEQLKVVFGDKKLKSIINTKPAVVNAVSSNTKRTNTSNESARRGKIICHYCSQPGHKKPYCTIKKSDEEAGVIRTKVGDAVRSSTETSSKRKASEELVPVNATKKAVKIPSKKEMELSFSSEDDEVRMISKYLPNIVTNRSFIVDTGSGHSLVNSKEWIKSELIV